MTDGIKVFHNGNGPLPDDNVTTLKNGTSPAESRAIQAPTKDSPELADLKSQVADLVSNLEGAETHIGQLTEDLGKVNEANSTLTAEIATTSAALAAANAEIAALKSEVEKLTAENADLVKSLEDATAPTQGEAGEKPAEETPPDQPPA